MKKAVKETRGKRLIYEETIGESRAKWLDWVIAISAT
jgi:hypothetical protein